MNLRQILDVDQGLGDTVKRITRKVGVKPCRPCEERAEMLNKLFPYRSETGSREDLNKKRK